HSGWWPLAWMELDRAAAARHPQIDLDRGAFYENGLAVANRQFRPHLLDHDRFRGGLDRMRRVIHRGGHTTIADAAVGMYGFEEEWGHLTAVMEQDTTPFRIQFMPMARGPKGEEPVEASRAWMADLRTRNTHRLRFSDHVKLFADGGFFAELMMLAPPGYLDGHEGEWLTAPPTFEAIAEVAWLAGQHLHVHTTGDLGVELALSTLERLQRDHPRLDHRFTFEHFGVSTPEQVARMARVGAVASVNVYYVHELDRAFADHTLGYERASQMSRVGSLERAGVPFSLHSDFTMAPARPLYNAWVAVNRICESGEVMAPNERATLEAALRAITSNAAHVLGLDDEIGTLRAGKSADLVALDADPWEVGGAGLADITVRGTVFEGQVFAGDALAPSAPTIAPTGGRA
ncbi:MAG: amidohydrolase family protein, partial [Actinomycetota bacterium]